MEKGPVRRTVRLLAGGKAARKQGVEASWTVEPSSRNARRPRQEGGELSSKVWQTGSAALRSTRSSSRARAREYAPVLAQRLRWRARWQSGSAWGAKRG